MIEALSPLRLPGFRPLAGAYTVNELGNWLGEIALAVVVFDQTGSPLATAALFLGMHFLPAVLSQGLVTRLEMSGIARALPLIYLAEGLVFLLIALSIDQVGLGIIIGLAAIDGILAIVSRTFTRTATGAVLKPAGLLRQGNAILNVCFTVVGAAGPAIAGIVVATAGSQTALFADAVSFMLVALALFAIRRVLPLMEAEEDDWRARLKDGLDYVRKRPSLSRLICANGAALMFLTVVIPIEIVYAYEALGAGSSGYGALLAAWGVGMVFGSVVFAAMRKTSLKILLFFSAIALATATMGMSIAQTLLVACLINAVGGVGNGVMWVATMSAVQEMTTDRYQARVVGLLEATSSAVPGIGFVIGGFVTEMASPRTAYLVAGAGALLVIAIAAPLLARNAWKRESSTDLSGADQLRSIDAADAPLVP